MTKKVRQIDLHRIHLQNTNKACESASNDFSLSETTMREQHLLRLKLNNANKEL